MPIGTRNSISVNSETNPITATASVDIGFSHSPDFEISSTGFINSGWKISR
jgi:hypothetical protein